MYTKTIGLLEPYAVAIKKEGSVVGHMPRTISCVCIVFIQKHGTITCTITRTRRFSSDLPQGSLELPCEYTFTVGLSDSKNNAITIVKQWLFTIMNSITIVYGQYFSS